MANAAEARCLIVFLAANWPQYLANHPSFGGNKFMPN